MLRKTGKVLPVEECRRKLDNEATNILGDLFLSENWTLMLSYELESAYNKQNLPIFTPCVCFSLSLSVLSSAPFCLIIKYLLVGCYCPKWWMRMKMETFLHASWLLWIFSSKEILNPKGTSREGRILYTGRLHKLYYPLFKRVCLWILYILMLLNATLKAYGEL